MLDSHGVPAHDYRADASEWGYVVRIRFVVGRRSSEPRDRRSDNNQSYVATFQVGPGGPAVAAYSFNEGAGRAPRTHRETGTRADRNAAWTTRQVRERADFNGTERAGDGPRLPSLRLTTAMTLEAWVYPDHSQ